MIKGYLYYKDRSKRDEASLKISDEEFLLEVNEKTIYKDKLSTLSISSRMANVHRKINFSNGLVLVSKDDELIDKELLKKTSILSYLEKYLISSVFFVALIILFSFSFVKFGIPSISEKLSYIVPMKLNNILTKNTTEFLDKYVFKESELDLKKQEEIQKIFKDEILPLINKEKFDYKIYFKNWENNGKEIANALALPNGTIILTDKFVKLALKDELKAVIFHEIAHIKQRHGLRMVVSNTLMASILIIVFGDVNFIADLGIGVGTMLVNSGYSRDFEYEADLFALKTMLKNDIDPSNLQNILIKITNKNEVKNEEDKNLSGYFSSHPKTEERNNIVKKFSNCYKKNLKICK